ncbi:MAG: 4Fe-4S dicluster domain-containing protein [Candidatus Bathyarchaeota archaeon]|nr:4Fe-4S dicluster domain-containing protein [Candidatus Bathyarchaeota archaeon]
MPLKTVKKDAADALTLEWVLQVKNYKLTLDKNRCVGCQICSLAYPKEAIKTQKQPKIQGEKAKKAKVDIDLTKCNFCGICDVTCPHGAIKVTLNGAHDLSILAKESYPQLVRDIKVDTHQCQKECVECETACPLSLIKISKIGYDGKPVENIEALSPSQKKRVQVNLDIQKDYCPTCRVCEFKCSPGALKVKKAFEGIIAINQEKCPEGCTDCLDVCPITGALTLGEDKKVHVNELFCTYCGACKNVCPVDEALTVKRTKIHHTPIHSGTWNKALERLTSPHDAVKELKTQADENRRKVVSKRFVLEETVK